MSSKVCILNSTVTLSQYLLLPHSSLIDLGIGARPKTPFSTSLTLFIHFRITDKIVHNDAQDCGQPGFTLAERKRFGAILKEGRLVDAYRYLHKEKDMERGFSWSGSHWEVSRKKNENRLFRGFRKAQGQDCYM
ncbi:hypothetical protein REPUB_Repub07fG0032000 [Reevesia pubescens]